MDKKPLIVVSICAVVLLVIGSLSNEVGYQSVKSIMNDSPLFQTRTQRATNQQQNIIISKYLGNGKENLFQFPIRDNNCALLKRAIKIIINMDDRTFEQFVELCIHKVKHNPILRDTDSKEISQILHQLRTKPDRIASSFISKNNQSNTMFLYTLCKWIPGCIPYIICEIIIGTIILIFVYIIFGPDYTSDCPTADLN